MDEKGSTYPRRILKNKVFLYLTEFFAGMSVMAVELGASRLLAPYFSSSQIVWTIIIGTIMIAMALGNLYGGKKADRNPNPDKLYGRIIIAGIWIGLIPVVGKYIIIGISALLVFAVNSNFLVIAGFAACMVLFVFPLFLLGTVTPSLVKYTMDSLDDSASIVGKLNASNTIGSIIGTFVPTFISIPAVGTNITFLIFAGILLALCAVYFITSKISIKKIKKLPVSIVIFILCCAFGSNSSFAFWQSDLIYEDESVYNYLHVYEQGNKTILSTNVLFGVQSVYMKEKGITGLFYDYALPSCLMAGIKETDNFDILILGNGAGTFATQIQRYFTGTNIEGVEIDEKITNLARKYFDMSDDVKVTTYDGRAYLNSIDKKYDLIMVDAYQDITIPFQMSSVEFFTLVKNHLKEDGVMLVNMNMKASGENNINDYLADTIAAVFPTVYMIDVQNTTNREVFASCNPDIKERMILNAMTEDGELLPFSGYVAERLITYVPGDRIMTDDKAPVELLGMKAIDDIISTEVKSFKEIYDKEGFKGLIKYL